MTTMEGLAGRLRDGDGFAYNAGYGALVTVALSFIPFSSILGGAVAAYRYEGGYLTGFGMGTAAGVAAAVPLIVFFVPALRIASQFGLGLPPSSPAYDLFLALVGLFFLIYTVVFSALGGLVGVWIDRNTDWTLDPEDWF